MKSIIKSIKTKEVLIGLVINFTIQIYSAITLVLLIISSKVFLINGGSTFQSLLIVIISSVTAIISGLILFVICLTRIRSIYIFLANLILGIVLIIILLIFPGLFIGTLGSIIFLSFWQYFLVYGAGYFSYFRIKSVFLSFIAYSFWYLAMIAVSIAPRLIQIDNLSSQSIGNNFGVLWQGPEILLTLIFLGLLAILFLVESRARLANWQKDLQSKLRLPLRNYIVVALVVVITILLVSIIAPFLWRLNTQYNSADTNDQRPSKQSQDQKPSSSVPGKEQSPGGKLPSNLPPSGNSIFAVVRYDKQLPREIQYFRNQVYDQYQNITGFSNTGDQDSLVKDDGKRFKGFYSTSQSNYEKTIDLYQSIAIVSDQTQSVFANTKLYEVGFLSKRPGPRFYGYSNGVVVTGNPTQLQSGDNLYVLSEVPNATITDLENFIPSTNYYNPANSDANYTQLSDPVVNALANKIVGSETNYYKRIQLIKDYLLNNYALNNDSANLQSLKLTDIKTFLFVTKKGSSPLFAASLVAMLVNLKSPIEAKVVGGYKTSQYDDVAKAYVINTNDLNYWVEVNYGRFGWINIDPVPASSSPTEQLSPDQQQTYDQQLNQDQIDQLEMHNQNLPKNKTVSPFNNAPDLTGLTPLVKIVEILLILSCGLGISFIALAPPVIKYLLWKRDMSLYRNVGAEVRVKIYARALQRIMKYFKLQKYSYETYLEYSRRISIQLHNGRYKDNQNLEQVSNDLAKLAGLLNLAYYSKSQLEIDRVKILVIKVVRGVFQLHGFRSISAIYFRY